MRADIKVLKNTGALIMREALNKGALFILLMLIGRVLGKEALGRYSLAIAISQIFFFGTELGLNTLIIREVAREKLLAGKFIVNVGMVRLVSGSLTMALIWITAQVLGAKGEAAGAIYLCGASYFFVNITNLYTSVFRAFERMELELLVAVVKNIIFLPAAVWMLFNGLGLIAIFNIFLASNILALIAAKIIFIGRIGMPSWKPDFAFLKGQLRETATLWVSQLLGITYLKLAPLLLFRLKGAEAVGIYNAGFVVVDGFWILSGCFILSLFPVISHLGRVSLAEARKEYLKGRRIIFFTFLILGAIFVLAAGNMVPLFYGKKFIEVVPLFRLLLIPSILVALDAHNSLTMIAMGKQFLLPFINGAGLLVNFVLSVFFILRFGYIGPAYALIISEALVFALMTGVLRRINKPAYRQAGIKRDKEIT